MSVWAIDDPTEDEEPLHCPGCGAVGDAPCDADCVYADAPDVLAASADLYIDEQASSDRDPLGRYFLGPSICSCLSTRPGPYSSRRRRDTKQPRPTGAASPGGGSSRK